MSTVRYVSVNVFFWGGGTDINPLGLQVHEQLLMGTLEHQWQRHRH